MRAFDMMHGYATARTDCITPCTVIKTTKWTHHAMTMWTIVGMATLASADAPVAGHDVAQWRDQEPSQRIVQDVALCGHSSRLNVTLRLGIQF